jgi:hypothetical protein
VTAKLRLEQVRYLVCSSLMLCATVHADASLSLSLSLSLCFLLLCSWRSVHGSSIESVVRVHVMPIRPHLEASELARDSRTLLQVTFGATGDWSPALALTGGGPVSAVDVPTVFADPAVTVRHMCGPRNCSASAASVYASRPLGCSEAGFLRGDDAWLLDAIAVRALA